MSAYRASGLVLGPKADNAGFSKKGGSAAGASRAKLLDIADLLKTILIVG